MSPIIKYRWPKFKGIFLVISHKRIEHLFTLQLQRVVRSKLQYAYIRETRVIVIFITSYYRLILNIDKHVTNNVLSNEGIFFFIK